MISFSISLDYGDVQRVFSALHRLKRQANRLAIVMPYRMALDFADLLRTNISTGAFSGSYPPYSKKYKEYKQLMVGHLRPWVLFGDVLANISVFKHANGYMAGIPAGRMDRGEKGWFGTGAPSSIAAYARANEFGEGPTPARPVFRPSLVGYKRRGIRTQTRRALNELKGVWR